MKLIKKSVLDVTETFLIPQTARTDNILLTCLLDIKEVVCNLLQKTVANKPERWRLLPTHFQLQLQKKFKCLVKPPEYRNKGLTSKTDRKGTALHCKELESINNQVQLSDSYLQKQQTNTTPKITNDQDWPLLIKANAADHPARDKLQPNRYSSKNVLAGQSILCVGGRAALYPEYHHLIASLGARLLIYRGSLENNMNRLYTLLESADMIICPIDCVNHNDFFAVKFYCKFSGKPYTLLDHSNLAAFNKGLKTLTKLVSMHLFINKNSQVTTIQQN